MEDSGSQATAARRIASRADLCMRLGFKLREQIGAPQNGQEETPTLWTIALSPKLCYSPVWRRAAPRASEAGKFGLMAWL